MTKVKVNVYRYQGVWCYAVFGDDGFDSSDTVGCLDDTPQDEVTAEVAAMFPGADVDLMTARSLDAIWESREYIGVRVCDAEINLEVGLILPPSVDMPDGEIRRECLHCDHATGGESQRGCCECPTCLGEDDCEHEMAVVELPGTCCFFAGTREKLDAAIAEARKYSLGVSSRIVVVGSNDRCNGHYLVEEYMGAVMANAEVLAILE